MLITAEYIFLFVSQSKDTVCFIDNGDAGICLNVEPNSLSSAKISQMYMYIYFDIFIFRCIDVSFGICRCELL